MILVRKEKLFGTGMCRKACSRPFFCKCCLKDAVSNSDILHIFSVDMVIRYSWGMSNFAT